MVTLSDCCVYWLPQLRIVSHIWFLKIERFSKNERIFTVPLYDSTFLDKCMKLNRRRFDELTPEANLNESVSGQKVLIMNYFE